VLWCVTEAEWLTVKEVLYLQNWRDTSQKMWFIMPPPLSGALSDDTVWRLSRSSELSRQQRCLGRLKLASRGSPCHTWLGHHFQGQKVKGQGHKGGTYCGGLLHSLLSLQRSSRENKAAENKSSLPLPLDVQKLKAFSGSGGFAPWPPDQRLCPWTPLGVLPQNSRYRFALPRSTWR